ncbi:hypothetical protein [Clostridium estertheticum]|uniref:hypothetical protein n=1 Tax=Clostridium estertheticum TaxID=238834 RepID=UPI001CF42286|nr:hypothetical protein [Clostridium estertheticum]MCB2354464.1 hypothetical protein [Clostridium estertheticum]WAG42423.1 hypothetical protein LL065_07025 [Clostridium estertheticum]
MKVEYDIDNENSIQRRRIMMDDKIIEIPISYDQRKINEYGQGYVECGVSNRWLQFNKQSPDLKVITVDVMTLNTNDKPHKICEMVLRVDDIMRALNSISK